MGFLALLQYTIRFAAVVERIVAVIVEHVATVVLMF